ncbi:Fe-S cluster assembly protein SufD [Halothiobacillus sp. DCM-1]|uniref:Fe-S cluster assembly protein SufD n=1 Tax=Halothiobacillus sp. DCM-1 TaxID=3112558 RepID=UPI003244AB3B
MNPSRSPLPQWLTDLSPADALAPIAVRQHAMAQAQTWGLPSLRDEEWRWTNLRPVTQFRPTTETPSAIPTADTLAAGLPDALVIRFIDGILQPLPQDCPVGLRVTALFDADETARQAAFRPDATDANDALLALNTALADTGIVLTLAANTVLDRPVWIDWQATGGAFSSPRILLKLGAHSQLTLLETDQGAANQASWRNGVMVVEQGENSALTHIHLGLSGSARLLTDRQFVELPRDARFTSINIQLDGQLIRREIDVNIRAPGGHCDLFGLLMPRGKQVMDTHTRLTHGAAHTTSDERYQIIADESGRGIFKGRILVAQDAQKIQAYQNSRNLLLSPTAEINTKPELEIYADDVKCSHGATIGQLDPEALYYLKSRGINETAARQLLIAGFAQEILDKLPLPALTGYLAAQIGALQQPLSDGARN